MADPFGVSFLPGGDAQYKRPQQGASQPLQEAIKVLSLRVPRVVGSSPLAPLALLQGQGGGGLPSGIIETLLRALSPPQGAPPVGAIPGGPQTPPPPMPTMGAPNVPQPVQPSIMGAPSAMARPQPVGAPTPFSNAPMPSVTAGAREPTSPDLMSPGTAPVPPEGPDARPGADAFWALARRLGQAQQG